jgi:hypothetical protein
MLMRPPRSETTGGKRSRIVFRKFNECVPDPSSVGLGSALASSFGLLLGSRPKLVARDCAGDRAFSSGGGDDCPGRGWLTAVAAEGSGTCFHLHPGVYRRPNVQTRMAVGQLAFFVAVLDAVRTLAKSVTYAHFIGTRTLGRLRTLWLG